MRRNDDQRTMKALEISGIIGQKPDRKEGGVSTGGGGRWRQWPGNSRQSGGGETSLWPADALHCTVRHAVVRCTVRHAVVRCTVRHAVVRSPARSQLAATTEVSFT